MRFIATILVLLGLFINIKAASVMLRWDRNPEPDVSAYLVYWGTNSYQWLGSTNVGNVTNATIYVPTTNRYWFIVTAYNGFESEPSRQISWKKGSNTIHAVFQMSTNYMQSWTNIDRVVFNIGPLVDNVFYRMKAELFASQPVLVLSNQAFVMSTNVNFGKPVAMAKSLTSPRGAELFSTTKMRKTSTTITTIAPPTP